MLESMTASQFWEWMQYAAIEPFGSFGDDLLMADLKALLANINTPKNKQFKPSEFLLFTKPPVEKQSIEEMWSLLTGESIH